MAQNGPIDTSYFSEKARKDLLQLLESVPGKKNLVLEESLVGSIELLAKFSTLQEYGVDRVFFLENKNVDSSQRNVVFIARGEKARIAQSIASQITHLQSTSQHDFSVFWVPRRTLVCEKILEEHGVLGDVSSLELPLLFQPVGKDLLSMELNDSFSDLYLRKDPTAVFLAAKALMGIQQRHGLFPRLMGKGSNARRLVDLLFHMRLESDAGINSVNGINPVDLMPSTTIEHIIIIDRDVDMASVLLTQLTYEGLIDEIFEISHSQTELDSSIVGNAPQSGSQGSLPQQQPSLKQKVKLDNTDKLYDQLRDTNFAVVGGLLNKFARRLQVEYESRHGNKTTSELRDFVSRLPAYQAEQQSLKIHTGLVEELMRQAQTDMFTKALEVQQNLVAGTDPISLHELVEDLIARDCPLPTVVRLLCLESCLVGGLRPKDFDSFKREIVQAYGYQHVMTLDALDKMQLLQSRGAGTALSILGTGASASVGATTNYAAVRKPLHLVMDEVNEQDPNDIAYAYSGYAPLSVRLVQCILQKPYLTSLAKSNTASAAGDSSQGWQGFEDIIKNVKGKTFDEAQTTFDKSSRARQLLTGRGEKMTSIVFFLGGISFAEIAALRLIAKQEEQRRRILICTTSIISGNRMMQAAIDTSIVGPR